MIGINSFPFSGVAAASFKQVLPVVGTVADVTDEHVFKWLQWLQWGVTFSQVVWLIGC